MQNSIIGLGGSYVCNFTHDPTWCIFLAELVSQILSYTNPLDIVRWRTVSRLLNFELYG